MAHETDTPGGAHATAQALQDMLLDRATNGFGDEAEYTKLRRALLDDAALVPLVPVFVRNCRSLQQFWAYIKQQSPQWQPRRAHIWAAFAPVLEYLERGNQTPADSAVGTVLATFDTAGVHQVWEKALSRRESDPEGAITAARTLLETVCKRILDKLGVSYVEAEDLPPLYFKVAEALRLAPSQHTETVFKAILGNCQQVVSNLGTLRNRISDAHGRGGKPVKPGARHAALAVNLAGTVATFLVETWAARREEKSS